MSAYVDPLKDWGDVALGRGLKQTLWCHLIADTHDELMRVARLLKLKPCWIQDAGTEYEHFDLTPSKRRQAVMAGAIELSHRDFAVKTHEKRSNRDEVS